MRSRWTILTAFLLICCSTTFAIQNPYGRKYARDTFGARTIVGVAAGAGINHARNSPYEWGGGIAGFGKRLGSAVGEHAIKNTIEFGVATIRHEDLSYRPSGKKGFGPRLKYALISTVVARKTTTGEKTIASEAPGAHA